MDGLLLRQRGASGLRHDRLELEQGDLPAERRGGEYQPVAELSDSLEHAGHVVRRTLAIGRQPSALAAHGVAEQGELRRPFLLPLIATVPHRREVRREAELAALDADEAEGG